MGWINHRTRKFGLQKWREKGEDVEIADDDESDGVPPDAPTEIARVKQGDAEDEQNINSALSLSSWP
jgi:hypothetical protein